MRGWVACASATSSASCNPLTTAVTVVAVGHEQAVNGHEFVATSARSGQDSSIVLLL